MSINPYSTKPYMTSQDLIASIQRKISFPISQNTFTNNDILAMANEEMFIAQVPSVLQYHSEYFVNFKVVPLIANVSNYAIPNRCIGMKLRDVFWMDYNGNWFEMTQIEEHDRAFYQRNLGTNESIHKFFMEGNHVVLAPSVVQGPVGFLVFVFYIRPNQLVKNDRAAIINNFQQSTTINSSLMNPGDTFTISPDANATTPVSLIPFTAVSSLGGTISDITIASSAETLVTTTLPHQLTSGQTVVITGTNSNPVIDGTYTATVEGPNTYTIPIQIGVAGTSGSFTSKNQFLINASSSITATNLAAAINSLDIIENATATSNSIMFEYYNIYTQFLTTNSLGFVINFNNTIGINFQTLPASYTDNETNITEPLFVTGATVDFLQTNPGHRTYSYDVYLPSGSINGTILTLPYQQLMIPSGTMSGPIGLPENNGIVSTQNQYYGLPEYNQALPGSSPGLIYILSPLIPGDYMCLSGEAIIPQIPPDLHTGLAERTSARILAAIGDAQGLQVANAKISEIESRQGNLMSNRSDGNPLKVGQRKSLLAWGKFRSFRRV